ncbi:MAG TPA: hypothetical protein VNJ03_07170 [Vicinamibacterales bacterium]|nr:hypothetical protein [Vicinamibacterales bacterium]
MTTPQGSELPSPRQLLHATLLAIVIAALILLTVVLPAEYGIDPTGVGRGLGIFRPAAVAAVPEDGAPAAAPAAAQPLLKSPTPYRSDEMTLTLASGEGGEIKAAMRQGERFVFTWTTTGGGVDVDMHGDVANAPKDASVSYWKDEMQQSGHGAFEAPAAGNFGWFWQNLNDTPVTVTVKTSGFYERLLRP